MKWTVITAGTASYRQWIERTRKTCAKLGYGFFCWDLGGLGIGEPIQVERIKPGGPRSPFKPMLIMEACKDLEDDTAIAWLDGDAELVGELPNEFPWNVAVAIHETTDQERSERGYRNPYSINAGVVMWGDASLCFEFCQEWFDELHEQTSGSDQDALNEIFWDQWGIGVLPAHTWNMRGGLIPRWARIIHHEGPKTRELEDA